MIQTVCRPPQLDKSQQVLLCISSSNPLSEALYVEASGMCSKKHSSI